MEDKKLFLLDAYALIYRAYYALMRSPRLTSYGLNTSAVFGFVNTLDELLRKNNPGYIAVCFDPAGGKTFRHEQYEAYKAGRDKQPEDITIAIPYIKDILAAYRIPVIECERYEADDVIGTLAHRASAEGFTTYMVTPDKDYGQLVSGSVFMYRPALKGMDFEIRGPQEVCERYGITSPSQVIDLLALEGDASDNVPGCPGVGEKTAAKLIAQFGSVENLLEHTDELKGALRKKIEDNAGQIRHSKWLVTICTDVPLDITPADLCRREPDTEALAAIFRKLEFRNFLARLGVSSEKPAAASAPKTAVPESLFDFADAEAAENAPSHISELLPQDVVTELTDATAVAGFAAAAAKTRFVGITILADGAEAMTAAIRGIALAYIPDAAEAGTTVAYIPVRQPDSGYAAALSAIFSDTGLTAVSDDMKRDMILLRRLGINPACKYFDTSVAHYLCSPETKHDPGSLAMIYLGYRLEDDGSPRGAAERAALALKLMPLLRREISDKGEDKLLDEVEIPLVKVLAAMEWEGARIDPTELLRLSKDLSGRLAALEKQAFDLAGHSFNVSSPSQVGTVLFDELKIDPKARKTKGGSWSTAEDTLEKYAAGVPLVRVILDIRGLKKLLATYIDALPKLINPRTGKIHTTYNQTVTATGRISSANPNLQNIPIRSADGRDIRRAFIADPGDLLLSADYSQIELRLMADLSGDPDMKEAFISGEDIHRATAAKIYHKALSEVSEDERRHAKTANFGIIYGISAFGLSERLGIPRAEAKNLIEGYLATYPGVAGYMKKAVETARETGYVSTIMGRRRYLPDINSRSNTVRSYAERNAINAPLQGSAADIIKLAMVRIYNEMESRGMRSRMILQVHDELIFNVKPDEVADLQELVARQMKKAYSGNVPMEVASGIASNWLDAH